MTSFMGEADGAGPWLAAAAPDPIDPVGHAAGRIGGSFTGNMDNIRIGDLAILDTVMATSRFYTLAANNTSVRLEISGSGFTYDSSGHLSGGTFETFDFNDGANGHFSLAMTGISATSFFQWIQDGATQAAFNTLFAGDDNLGGRDTNDLIHAFGGNDVLDGGGGSDTLFGGAGNDTITANFNQGEPIGTSYLRGEDGDDSISGGSLFDDINGNMGNDTAHGNAGDDWVVGGKDNDQLFGDAGNDIVWGNLGNDTLDGGPGNDQVRGGQGDDVVNGGDGNDYVSGDRGNDTITGGAGADVFHGSQDAGIDRVMDFSLAEGDKVMLDPGTTYTVSQVGADTVIDMGNGNQMILQSVQMSTLPPGTIFLG